jgi:hypothetical protein
VRNDMGQCGTDTSARVNACDTPEKYEALVAEFAGQVGRYLDTARLALILEDRKWSVSCLTAIWYLAAATG